MTTPSFPARWKTMESRQRGQWIAGGIVATLLLSFVFHELRDLSRSAPHAAEQPASSQSLRTTDLTSYGTDQRYRPRGVTSPLQPLSPGGPLPVSPPPRIVIPTIPVTSGGGAKPDPPTIDDSSNSQPVAIPAKPGDTFTGLIEAVGKPSVDAELTFLSVDRNRKRAELVLFLADAPYRAVFEGAIRDDGSLLLEQTLFHHYFYNGQGKEMVTPIPEPLSLIFDGDDRLVGQRDRLSLRLKRNPTATAEATALLLKSPLLTLQGQTWTGFAGESDHSALPISIRFVRVDERRKHVQAVVQVGNNPRLRGLFAGAILADGLSLSLTQTARGGPIGVNGTIGRFIGLGNRWPLDLYLIRNGKLVGHRHDHLLRLSKKGDNR